MNRINHSKDIWSITNALDVESCDNCIASAEGEKLFPCSIIDNEENNFLSRSNYRLFLNSFELADLIWNNIATLVPQNHMNYTAHRLNQEFRFYKYLPTQEFKKHQDVPTIIDKHERSFFSLLIYLNDNFLGGETIFNKLAIKPIKGTALIFPHTFYHSGNIVKEGLKYVLRSDIIYKLY